MKSLMLHYIPYQNHLPKPLMHLHFQECYLWYTLRIMSNMSFTLFIFPNFCAQIHPHNASSNLPIFMWSWAYFEVLWPIIQIVLNTTWSWDLPTNTKTSIMRESCSLTGWHLIKQLVSILHVLLTLQHLGSNCLSC